LARHRLIYEFPAAVNAFHKAAGQSFSPQPAALIVVIPFLDELLEVGVYTGVRPLR
jgi:hypothetical protein